MALALIDLREWRRILAIKYATHSVGSRSFFWNTEAEILAYKHIIIHSQHLSSFL
jgi:hypothetical protein